MAWSLFPMMIFHGAETILLTELEYTKTGMVLSLVALPVNAFLCWVLIFGKLGATTPGTGRAGIATLITRVCRQCDGHRYLPPSHI
jgi:MATE family multidrug resistance protein